MRTFSHEDSWESMDNKQSANVMQQQQHEIYTGAAIDSQRTDSRNFISRPSSWKEAWQNNAREWNEHWIDFFRDIYRNPENSKLEVVLLSVELPFTILRKVSPLHCICGFSFRRVHISLISSN